MLFRWAAAEGDEKREGAIEGEGTRERKCESDISFTNVSSEITFIKNRILVEIYTSKNLALVLREENKTGNARKI